MKYKVKIDYPSCNYKIGTIKTENEWILDIRENPADFPDIFEKIKEPLFITHDGVEVFEGDKICIVYTYLFSNIQPYTHSVLIPLTQRLLNEHDSYKIFSNIENAEKWIEQNKPKFSIKQINDAIDSELDNNSIHKYYIDNFKKQLGI